MLSVAAHVLDPRDAPGRVASPPAVAWPVGPSGEMRVADGDAHVWVVVLDRDAATVRQLATLLDDDERDRAARFRRRIDRDRFIVAHGALRLVLARYLRRPPHTVRFRRDRFGKPSVVRHGGVSFNMTHSDALALIAVAPGYTVGVDVERVAAIDDAFDVAETCFAPAERRTLRALPASRTTEAFFACWTRKEAFIKAVGTGLSAPLKAFEVTLAPDAPARLCRVSGSARVAAAWTMRALEPAPGFVGAIAVRRPDVRVTMAQLHIPTATSGSV